MVVSETDAFPIDRLLKVFASDVGSVPALFWRADLVKNEITFLNEYGLSGLEESIPRLLQDAAGAENILAVEDRAAFVRFQERLRQRQPVSEVFRARSADGLMRWLYILGTPDPEMTFCYLGLLVECTGLANGILKRGSEAGLSEHVQLFDNPVFMVHVGSRRVIASNAAARNLFGFGDTQPGPALADLMGGNTETYLRDVYERLLFSRSWNGVLTLKAMDGHPIECMTRVRAYDRDGRALLWFSLSLRHDEKVPLPPAACDPEILHDLAQASDIRGLLQVLLDARPQDGHMEAVMLSQIFISEGRVAVTGLGKPFESLGDNDIFPYQGSIAENLVLFSLDHIIVEDTTKSIKPIDWALFIPGGIRSYYAVPLFIEGVLREVLIFCSTRPAAFRQDNIPPYAALAQAFWAELPRILWGE